MCEGNTHTHTHTHGMEFMERLYESPFAIPREDVQELLGQEGFVLLRSCLAGEAEYVLRYPSLPSYIHPPSALQHRLIIAFPASAPSTLHPTPKPAPHGSSTATSSTRSSCR